MIRLISLIILTVFFTLGLAQNYYISPEFNITINQENQISVGCQFSFGAKYNIAQTYIGIGSRYSMYNKEFITYNFFGVGITYVRYEYGNLKLKLNGQFKKGKRTNLLFGTPYSNSEFFHSIETSSILDRRDIKNYNWIKFPINIH